MGHLPIVDQSSLLNTIERGEIRVELGGLGSRNPVTSSQIKIQLADVLADALAVRPGDKVFPWLTGNRSAVAFDRECVVADRARHVPAAQHPIRIPLHPNSRCFNGLRESEALDLWSARLLWNAIGKKSLGRGRSITHQTPLEDDELLRRLRESGELEGHAIADPRDGEEHALTLSTSPVDSAIGDAHEEELRVADPVDRMRVFDPYRISWVRDGQFVNEKALEAWLMENHDRPRGEVFARRLTTSGQAVIWAANYLPYGVAGANIDCLFWAIDAGGNHHLSVVELKKDPLSASQLSAATDQVAGYVKYVNQFLERYLGRSDGFSVSGATLSGRAAHHTPSHSGTVRHLYYRVTDTGEVQFS